MLRYEPYTKDRLSIFGDKDKYGTILKDMGCRWNSRMPTPGWNISSSKESVIKKFVESVNKEHELKTVLTNAKKRTDQKKYHRAKSPLDSPKKLCKSPEKHQDSDVNREFTL